MAHSKRQTYNRDKMCPSVLEYAKNLDSADLPYAWIFYNEKENDKPYMEKVFYISEDYMYPKIVEAENYELVKTKSTNGNDSNDSIWVILPLSATRYVFYRKIDIPIEEYYFTKNVLVEWANDIRDNVYFITALGNV